MVTKEKIASYKRAINLFILALIIALFIMINIGEYFMGGIIYATLLVVVIIIMALGVTGVW